MKVNIDSVFAGPNVVEEEFGKRKTLPSGKKVKQTPKPKQVLKEVVDNRRELRTSTADKLDVISLNLKRKKYTQGLRKRNIYFLNSL